MSKELTWWEYKVDHVSWWFGYNLRTTCRRLADTSLCSKFRWHRGDCG